MPCPAQIPARSSHRQDFLIGAIRARTGAHSHDRKCWLHRGGVSPGIIPNAGTKSHRRPARCTLSLPAVPARARAPPQSPGLQQILPVHHFGLDEPALDVAVDRARGLLRVHAALDGPRAAFRLAAGEKRNQAQQPVARLNQRSRPIPPARRRASSRRPRRRPVPPAPLRSCRRTAPPPYAAWTPAFRGDTSRPRGRCPAASSSPRFSTYSMGLRVRNMKPVSIFCSSGLNSSSRSGVSLPAPGGSAAAAPAPFRAGSPSFSSNPFRRARCASMPAPDPFSISSISTFSISRIASSDPAFVRHRGVVEQPHHVRQRVGLAQAAPATPNSSRGPSASRRYRRTRSSRR
jgi:hypothetical protein